MFSRGATNVVRSWLVAASMGCAPAVEEPVTVPPQAPATTAFDAGSEADSGTGTDADAGTGEGTDGDAGTDTGTGTDSVHCPADMEYVDAVHCPDSTYVKVGLRCLKTSRNEPNHLTICHEFAPGQKCSVPTRRQRFCIDRYEFPSKEGAHPPVMVSAYDAAELCAEQGKRMCFESEWTAACEGPKLLPFPSGYQRSSKHCNIDNAYIHPHLDLVHASSDRVRGPELLRLDQSVLSGSLPSCKSGYGVYDLTGNFDEWVRTERVRGKGKWAALKGGAWGHVRNACRPVTTSHVPQWSYYFISFRCCKEPVKLRPPPQDGVATWTPLATPPPKRPPGSRLDRGWSPPPGTRGPHAPKP